jgi:hypothetical protein
MIAAVSAAVSASPLGRAFVKLHQGPVGDFFRLPILDWVIPPLLAVMIASFAGWLAFAPN